MNLSRSIPVWCVLVLFLAGPLHAQPAWKIFGDLAEARVNFQALAIGNSQVLVMGGYVGTQDIIRPTASCELIDLAAGTIVPVASMNHQRAAFVALLAPDSNVVAISGDRIGDENWGELTPAVELYDRASRTWRIIGSLKVPRYQHVATFINAHEILVVGGRHPDLATMADAEIFDIATGTSRIVAPFPFPVNNAVLGRSSTGEITLAAGRAGGVNSYRERNVYRYDVAGDRWSVIGTISRPVNASMILKLWDGRLLLSGGSYLEMSEQNPVLHDLSREVQIENANQWSTLALMQSERHWSAAAQWSPDTILTIGGFDNTAIRLRSTDRINVATGAGTPGPMMIHARSAFQAVSVPTGLDCRGMPQHIAVLAISGQDGQRGASPIPSVEIIESPACSPSRIVEPERRICAGESVRLQAPCGTNVQWSPAAGLSCTDCSNPVATPVVTTTYMVTDRAPCPTISEFRVVVLPAPRIDLPAALSLCPGDSIVLAATIENGAPPFIYRWSPALGVDRADVAGPVASPTSTTVYRLEIVDANRCTALSDPLTVTVHPQPAAPTITAMGDTLVSSPAVAYRWIRRDGTPVPNAGGRSVVVPPGRYAVETVDINGCTAVSEYIRVGSVRRARLDTVAGRVGEPLRLTMRVDPPIEADEKIGSIRARLLVEPTALTVADVHSPDRKEANEPAAYGIGLDGTITVDRPNGSAPLSGETLFQIEVVGLVTGRPENRVRIDSVLLDGELLRVAGHGLVLLEGCDIAHPATFDRPVSILRVTPNPLAGTGLIRYRAPSGHQIEFHLSNLAGERLTSGRLPDGTGLEQEAVLELDDPASGLYRLELRDRHERSVMTIMVVR